MSVQAVFAIPVPDPHAAERRHKIRLVLGYALAIALIVAVTAYGFDYYKLDRLQRPFSPKHRVLRPSGAVGIKLGILGVCLFATIFIYPLRKRWKWLRSKGSSKHWLDFHVLLGLLAPVVIAFHASFKFQGIAGMAFWLMFSVALSGIVGRYLYAQIPRRVNAAELSLKESQELQRSLVQKLAAQDVVSEKKLAPLFRLPSESRVARWPLFVCLGYMVALDVIRPFHVARVRWDHLSAFRMLTTLGGLLPSGREELEQVVKLAREQAWLSKQVIFLSRAQQVFHLWHVVHKPFSYSFAVLALLHIGVVVALGYL